jgi:hypothetical protein
MNVDSPRAKKSTAPMRVKSIDDADLRFGGGHSSPSGRG